MEKLLKDIDSDVTSISLSRSSSSTLSGYSETSTLVAKENVVEKMCTSVGRFFKRGLGEVAARKRLHQIWRHMQDEEVYIPQDMCTDLLEFQRYVI